MITRYIIPIRLAIVLLVVLTTMFYISGQNQLKAANNSPESVNNSQAVSVFSKETCLRELSNCKVDVGSTRVGNSDSNARKVATASNSTSACQSNRLDTSTYAYNQAIDKILAQANSTIDGYRQTALVSGESYIDFNNQLSNLFVLYNAQIQQDYGNYISELGGCHATITAPESFQDFD